MSKIKGEQIGSFKSVRLDSQASAPTLASNENAIFIKTDGKVYKKIGTSAEEEIGTGSGGGSGATSLSQLTDISLISLSNGQFLKYNITSGKWENVLISLTDISSGSGNTYKFAVFDNNTNLNFVTVSPNSVVITDSNGYPISSPDVSLSKLNFLKNLTSDIQSQLNGKLSTVTGNAGEFITLDANGNIVSAGVKQGNDGTASTIPNSLQVTNQINTTVTQALLNTPSLPFVHFATTANISTFSGLSAIDGYTPTAGQFLLVKNQTNADNSVWIVASGAWTRAYYDSSSNSWQPITTQTTYSQLNINGGIVNVLNGTANKNIQFQFNIVNPSAVFRSSTVYVTSTTKLPQRNTSIGYVSTNTGNNSLNNGTDAFPYATVTQDLVGASFPHITNISPSGSSYTESLTITSGQSNLSLICVDSTDAGKVQFTSPITLATGNTRYREVGITRSTGSSVPVVLNSGNLGRHTFENSILITTGTSLMTIDASLQNWINLYNIDATGSPLASIPLTDFTSPFTINIFRQTKYLPFSLISGKTGLNCTINVYNSIKGAVVVPPGFAGILNYYDSYNVNQVITNQTTLSSILTNTTLSGFYAVSFSSPTGMPAGSIFLKLSASGVTVNNVCEFFTTAPSSIYDNNTKKTYLKDSTGTFNRWISVSSSLEVVSISTTTTPNPNTTTLSSWNSTVYVDCTNQNIILTLPPSSSSSNGQQIEVKKIDSTSNWIKIIPNGSSKLDGSNSNISYILLQGDSIVIRSDGTDANTVSGNINIKTRLITKTNHGYTTANPLITRDGGNYILAKGNSSTTSDVIGWIVAVLDANNFIIALTDQYLKNLSGLVDGQEYFLSASTSGALADGEPYVPGHVSAPVFVADSTTSGYFRVQRPTMIIGNIPRVCSVVTGSFTLNNTFQDIVCRNNSNINIILPPLSQGYHGMEFTIGKDGAGNVNLQVSSDTTTNQIQQIGSTVLGSSLSLSSYGTYIIQGVYATISGTIYSYWRIK